MVPAQVAGQRNDARSLARPCALAHDRRMEPPLAHAVHADVAPRLGAGCVATIVVAAIAVYARALSGGFVYDDLTLIAQNPGLHDCSDLAAIWASPLWGEQLGHWRPLTAQLLALGYAATPQSAAGIHAISLALLASAAVAAALLARRLGATPRTATLAALLFLLHPANAEVASWCSALNDALLAACTLFGLDRWLAWRENGRKLDLVSALALAVAAMLAKEAGVFAPAIYVASDVATGRARLAARALPMLGAAVSCWLAARMAVFGELGAGLFRTTFTHEGSAFGNAIAVGGGLAQRLVFPFARDMFEGPREVTVVPAWIAAFALLAAFRFGIPRTGVAGRIACILACASLVPPMLTVANLGPYPVADRYLTLAAAGWGMLVAAMAQRWNGAARFVPHVVIALYAAVSWSRVPEWRDQETFVAHSLAQRPRDPRLHLMRGTLLLERAQAGDAAAAAGAHTALLEAKRLLGDDLVRKDQLLALRRDVAIGLAWISMFVPGPDGGPDWSRVEREFTTVTTEWPDRADAFVGLGVALAAGGKLERGQAALERAIALDPGTAAAHHNLAKVLQLRGDLLGARSRLQEALRIRPDDAQSKAMLEAVERQLAGR